MIKLKILVTQIIVLAISLNFGISQMRHGMPNAEERAKRLTERLKTELKLDEKQSIKVNDILLKYAKKLDNLIDQNKAHSEMIEIMNKHMKEQDKEIKNVLTKEQFNKYEKIMEDNRNRIKRRN